MRPQAQEEERMERIQDLWPDWRKRTEGKTLLPKPDASDKVIKISELQTAIKINQQGECATAAKIGVQEQSAEGGCNFPSVPSFRDSERYETVKLLREEIAELR